ncbi:MAG: hypothetical protein ISP86_05455, partial [Shewanellaceae bacterium]|nr:hypothetical protein [Shewanellaceae bacterium]
LIIVVLNVVIVISWLPPKFRLATCPNAHHHHWHGGDGLGSRWIRARFKSAKPKTARSAQQRSPASVGLARIQ